MKPPALRLIVNIHGKEKSYILWNGTESYYEKLRSAYKDIQNNKNSDYLNFAFFTLCAATLEFSLNFLLTNYCVNHFTLDQYKPFAEGYISQSFPKKLLMTPHIISTGKLEFNQKHESFKNLLDLIQLRNKILHNKEFLEKFDFPNFAEHKDKKELNLVIKLKPNHIDTLTKEKCIRFGNSLGDFKKFVMIPALNNRLRKNEMLIKN